MAFVTYSSGVFGVSRNDDWVYFRSASLLRESGYFWTFGSTAFLAGQSSIAVLLMGLFGPNIAVLQIFVTTLASWILVVTYILARKVLSPGLAAISVLPLLISPIFVSLSTSFMTDIPAYAFMLTTILFGVLALEGNNNQIKFGWFIAALLTGFIGFTIREFSASAALVVITAVVLAAFRSSVRIRFWVLAVSTAWFGAVWTAFAWRKSVGGDPEFGFSPMAIPGVIEFLSQVFFTSAFLVAPILVLFSWKALSSSLTRVRLVSLLITGALIVIAWSKLYLGQASGLDSFFIGNYFTPFGSYSETLPGTPVRVFSEPLWRVFEIAALLSGLVITWILFSGKLDVFGSKFSSEYVVQSFLLLYVALWVGSVIFLKAPPFDRNLLPIIGIFPMVLIGLGYRRGLLAKLTTLRKIVFSFSLITAFGIGLHATTAAATFDALKWRVGKDFTERTGYPLTAVDSGLEWTGMTTPDLTLSAIRVDEAESYTWWSRLFPKKPVCAISHFRSVEEMFPEVPVLYRGSASTLFGTNYEISVMKGPDSCD